MRKIVISACVVFSILFTSVVLPLSEPAAACPVREPETLLPLYVSSDFIYRARYIGEEIGTPKNEGDGVTATEVKRTFGILATLKGKPSDAVSLYHNKYEYVDSGEGDEQAPDQLASTESEPGAESRLEDDGDDDTGDEPEDASTDADDDGLKPGQTVLLFLVRDEDTGRLQIAGFDAGMKTLEPDDMAVYETRVKELGPIMAKAKPDAGAIVDWLVRCAEERATRWEGTAELERSFRALAYKKEQEEKGVEAVRSWYVGGNPDYAEAVEEYHRQVLTNLFVRVSAQADPNGVAIGTVGDRELLQLISRWPDQRVAGALMAKLRAESSEAWELPPVMQTLSAILQRPRLAKLAEEFGKVAYGRDDAPAERPDEDPPEKNAGNETFPAEGEKLDPATAKPLTNAQLRRQILDRFIRLAAAAMGTPNGDAVDAVTPPAAAPLTPERKMAAAKSAAAAMVR